MDNIFDPNVGPESDRSFSPSQIESFLEEIAPPAWVEAYSAAKDHALATIEFEQRERLLLIASFLKNLDEACWEVQEERGVYTFSDLVHRLVTLQEAHDQSWDWLQYRLDCQIHDLALDEFQDTSLVQYRLLFRFMSEVLNSSTEDHRNFFLVGDPKQSIYGWRGGAPELIHEVAHAFPQLNRESLAKSYRSAPVLMDFVNRTFSVLQSMLKPLTLNLWLPTCQHRFQPPLGRMKQRLRLFQERQIGGWQDGSRITNPPIPRSRVW